MIWITNLFKLPIEIIKLLEGDKYPSQSLILFFLSVLEKETVKLKNSVMKTPNVSVMIEEAKTRLRVKTEEQQGRQLTPNQRKSHQRLETLISHSSSLFQHMCDDLIEEITELWDDLPVETLLSTCLDPRFKHLNHLDSSNREEALTSLAAEFDRLSTQSIPISNPEEEPPAKKQRSDLLSPFDLLQNSYLSVQRVETTHKNELQRYLDEQPIRFLIFNLQQFTFFVIFPIFTISRLTEDPLTWWKNHEKQYPVLATMAKIYLATPASQTSSERLFSCGSHVVSPLRSSLDPNNVEMLVLWCKNKDNFAEALNLTLKLSSLK